MHKAIFLMGLHVMMALAKLSLLSSSHASLSPLGASLLCVFVLKLGSSITLVRRTRTEALYASRLFLFQMGRIVFDEQEPVGAAGGAVTRLQRAMRLVWQRLVNARRSPTQQQSDEESLHALSMLAL